MTLCGWENAKISPTHVLHKTLRVYMSKNAPHYCEGAFLVGCEIDEKCYN